MVLYSQSEDVDLLVDVDQDFWKAAKEFFQQRRVQAPDLGGGGDWMGWSYELDGVRYVFSHLSASYQC